MHTLLVYIVSFAPFRTKMQDISTLNHRNRRRNRNWVRAILHRLDKAQSEPRDEARQERLRIFGYYEDTVSGATFSVSQIRDYLAAIRANIIPSTVADLDNLVYHKPEAETDYITSIGERYIPKGKNYPALQIWEGEIISDAKWVICCPNPQTYLHPRLRRKMDDES